MQSYQKWLEDTAIEPDHLPPQPDKNDSGGVDPSHKEKKKFKDVDLITLPQIVQGTNCGNCKYMKHKKGDMGFCTHDEVQTWVTKRMCCKEWDHADVKRKF